MYMNRRTVFPSYRCGHFCSGNNFSQYSETYCVDNTHAAFLMRVFRFGWVGRDNAGDRVLKGNKYIQRNRPFGLPLRSVDPNGLNWAFGNILFPTGPRFRELWPVTACHAITKMSNIIIVGATRWERTRWDLPSRHRSPWLCKTLWFRTLAKAFFWSYRQPLLIRSLAGRHRAVPERVLSRAGRHGKS